MCIKVKPNVPKAIEKHGYDHDDRLVDLRVPFHLTGISAHVNKTLHQLTPGLTPAFSMNPLKVVCLFKSG
jgi:hypothetical protein